jgi:hypothetical protein
VRLAEKNSAAILGSFIGRWASVLASKSRSPRVRFGGKSPGRVLLAHGERRGTSAAQWGPHVSGKEEGERNGPSGQTERGGGAHARPGRAAGPQGCWAARGGWLRLRGFVFFFNFFQYIFPKPFQREF